MLYEVITTGRELKEGADLAFLTIGPIGVKAQLAIEKIEKEGYSIAHYDMRFVKPLDQDLLHNVFKTHKNIITVEDGTIIGGMGSAILEFMSDHNYHARVKRLGVITSYSIHYTKLYEHCVISLDPTVLQNACRNAL